MPAYRPFARRLSARAPAVPATPLIVFDAMCVLCSGFVQWVIRHDQAAMFRFTSAQGPLGQMLYRDVGLDPVTFETNLVIIDGVVYGELAGVIEVAVRLGGVARGGDAETTSGALMFGIAPRFGEPAMFNFLAKCWRNFDAKHKTRAQEAGGCR